MSAITDAKVVAKNIKVIGKKMFANVEEAIQVTQLRVVNDAQAIVPVKTSTLLKSIAPGQVIIRPNFITGTVVARQNYASFVENGTSRQRPQPYMGPALRKNVKDFKARIKRATAI